MQISHPFHRKRRHPHQDFPPTESPLIHHRQQFSAVWPDERLYLFLSEKKRIFVAQWFPETEIDQGIKRECRANRQQFPLL